MYLSYEQITSHLVALGITEKKRNENSIWRLYIPLLVSIIYAQKEGTLCYLS